MNIETTDNMQNAFFAGVDWGTSRFRLWIMAADGAILGHDHSSEGMVYCAEAGFKPVLEAHLAKIGAPASLPVLICGMAGARQGWMEAPYLHTPTSLRDLFSSATVIADEQRDIRILPGLAQVIIDAPNVMRGEETLLLGAVDEAFSGVVCMPGTHCKWVSLEAGIVNRFQTFMTGELYSVMSQQSILVHAIEAGAIVTAGSAAFQLALRTALSKPSMVLSQLFSVRAAQLLDFEMKSAGAAHLSGLLIGAEVATMISAYGPQPIVTLVSAGPLCDLYAEALNQAGVTFKLIDAEKAARTGLLRAASQLWGKG